MRIAVCLSGFPRNYKETFDFFKKHVIDALNPDLFFFGYNQKSGVFDNEFVDKFKFTNYIIGDYTQDVSNEISLLCDGWKPTKLHSSTRFEGGCKSQFYNIYKSNELKNKFEKNNNITYDIIIRARFEAFFVRDITVEEILRYPENTISIPPEWNFKEIGGYGVTDQFAIGNKKMMDIYSDAIKYFKMYNNTHGVLCHPETLMGYHLHYNKLKINEIDPHYFWENPIDDSDSTRRAEKFLTTESI